MATNTRWQVRPCTLLYKASKFVIKAWKCKSDLPLRSPGVPLTPKAAGIRKPQRKLMSFLCMECVLDPPDCVCACVFECLGLSGGPSYLKLHTKTSLTPGMIRW